jgi:hypothetical protein
MKKRLFLQKKNIYFNMKIFSKKGILIHGDSYLKYENYKAKDFIHFYNMSLLKVKKKFDFL